MNFEELKEKLNREERFCKFNGMRLELVRENYAEAVMEITADSCNSLGIVQGGAIFALADLAFAGASFSCGDAVGFTAGINFIRPGTSGRLTARASLVNRGRRTCIYDVDVMNDQEKLVAHATFTGFNSNA